MDKNKVSNQLYNTDYGKLSPFGQRVVDLYTSQTTISPTISNYDSLGVKVTNLETENAQLRKENHELWVENEELRVELYQREIEDEDNPSRDTE